MLTVMQVRAKKRGADLSEVNFIPWRINDLRRTGATNLKSLRVPVEVTEAVLNHVSGTTGGVAGVYNLFRYEPQKCGALEAWSKLVANLITQENKKI